MIEKPLTIARCQELANVYRRGLLDDCIPFWMRHGLDREHGGLLTHLDHDGSVVDTDKSVWAQGRGAWMLAKLYNTVEKREEWLAAAQNLADFITQHCIDPTDGRMWFHVTRDGRPIRKRRYAFSESFAAIAYGELAVATGNEEYAAAAERCFRRFIDHNLNPQGVQPKFTDTRPLHGIGFPMITIVTAQELRNSIQLPEATEWIDRSINSIQTLFWKPELNVVMESVGPGGEISNHFDGRTLNPGHAIEGAWFIMAEGRTRGDDSLVQLGRQMLDAMWARGWDRDYGGILYFVDLHGGPVQEYWHDMKFWWPQNEALIATLLAYELSGDERYGAWHLQLHDWVYRHFPDPEHGEWFGYLHRDGRPSNTLKGSLWKGPFHLPRMLLECWRTAERLATTPSQA